MPLSRPLRLGRFLIAIGLTILACFAAAIALPHDPYIRYQAMADTIFARADWIYERIHHDDTPIDVLFIGSSRTARGVISPDIEARLAALGHDARVANFSLPASGYDIRLTLAREALETHDVKLLVVSLVEQFPRDGHQAFADLATRRDILTSPWLVNRNLPENLARLPVRQIQLAAKSQLPEAFGHRATFDPETYKGSTIDPRIFNPGKRKPPETTEAIAALEAESRTRRRDLTRPVLPENLAWVEFGVTRSYIRRIARLAEAKRTKLVFLYLPFYGGFERPFEEAWLSQLGPVLSADFLMSDPLNYNDVAHASQAGADLITHWLAEALVPYLAEDSKT